MATVGTLEQQTIEYYRELWSYAAISTEIGRSPAWISKVITRELDEAERQSIEREKRREKDNRVYGPLRDELLAHLPPCGCPQCSDPDCEVLPGRCHRCAEPVNKSPSTCRRERRVIGRPLMYCSRKCHAADLAARNAGTVSPRVAARRDLVAELHPEKTPQQIADVLGVHYQVVYDDLEQLEAAGRIERRPADEVRAEALRTANEAKSAAAVAALGQPGGCGSWACRDPACQVPPGQCHQERCRERAAIAPQTDSRKRWVTGTPVLGCSRHGPVWQAAAIASANARGLLTGQQAADKLQVAGLGHCVRSGLLVPDERTGWLTLFSQETIDQFEREKARCEDGRRRWTPKGAERYYDKRWLMHVAERHGIAYALAAAERVRQRADERLRRLRRRRSGRPTSHAVAAHHLDWAEHFLEIRENCERRHCDDEPMPSERRMCLEVALEDFTRHPDRWLLYDPTMMRGEAAARVRNAIKPLLIAGKKTTGA